METAEKEEKGNAVVEKRKGAWGKFYDFLAMGGFLLVLVAVVVIIILVSILFN